MKSMTAKGDSWNKEQYMNLVVRMQNCKRFQPRIGPKWNPKSTLELQKDKKNILTFTRIERVCDSIFGDFWYHLGGFGFILVAN